jgi:hypothetical protein
MNPPPFRAAANLSSDALVLLEAPPWQYDDTRPEGLTSKAKFRQWQLKETTNRIHFTLVEPVNPNLRIEEDNPPRRFFGWVADYDAHVEAEEFLRRVSKVDAEIRPVWFSRTFSGGIRAVWVFEEPVWADCPAVAEKFMRNFASRAKAQTLAPGLDPASYQPHMLWEHGTDWAPVPDSIPVPRAVTQSLYRDSVIQIKKIDAPYTDLPMDEIAAEVERRFPGRLYGNALEIGNRVPLFWLPITGDHKEKDRSAIVAEWGVYAFSSRASQGRMFWDELLGHEFVQKYKEKRLDQAMTGCYFDGKLYWRIDPKSGAWVSSTREDALLYLRVDRGLSNKLKGKETYSEADHALLCIQTMHRVDSTAPFLHTPEQFVEWNGELYLNTNRRRPMDPAPVGYGNPENFPWLATFFDNFFDQHEDDTFSPRDSFLAEIARSYRSLIDARPVQGHALIVCGAAGCGKSLLGTYILRHIFGSATDAGNFLAKGSAFNKALGESFIWFIDDNQSVGTMAAHKAFSEMLKKHVATPEVSVQPKHKDARDIPWFGRIYVSCNDDPDSVSIIPDLDINIADKLCLYRVNPDWRAEFQDTMDMQELLQHELPYFLRWLLDEFEVPSEILTPDRPRYGLQVYHHPGLVQAARESSAHFRMAQMLDIYRAQCRREDRTRYIEGTSSELLVQMMHPDSDVASLIRASSTSPIQFGRLLGALAKQEHGLPWLEKMPSKNNQSIWRIDTHETP